MLKNEKRRRILRLALCTFGALTALAGIYAVFAATGFGFPCIFRLITKLRCPGCGNTHAVDALLHFNFASAIGYNLLFPLEFLYILWVYVVSAVSYLRGGRFNYTSPHRAVDISILTVILSWWVVRNIIGI